MRALALLFAFTAATMAQTFEVAAIRPAVDDHSSTVDADKGFYQAHNLTLKRLITTAWGVDGRAVIGGPNWVASDHWDIRAKMPAEYTPRPQDSVLNPQDQFLKRMLQNLLAERFHLTVHRETRQADGYALVVAKSGLKIERAKPDEVAKLGGSNTYLRGTNVRMEVLAKVMADIGGRLGVDKTGLTGGYDFELHWAPADDSSSDLPPLFTAVQQQLGLQLESVKVPIQAVIIDRAEKPDGN